MDYFGYSSTPTPTLNKEVEQLKEKKKVDIWNNVHTHQSQIYVWKQYPYSWYSHHYQHTGS